MKGKTGTYAKLEDKIQPVSQTINLDSYMRKNHGALLKPDATPTPTPQKKIFTPAKDILNMKPQEIFSHKIPELDITQADRTNLIVEALQRGERNHAVSKNWGCS